MIHDLEMRIREMLGEILTGMDAYVVEIRMLPGRVEVFADRDPHITIEDCARISRYLVQRLNTLFPFSEQYGLEVSSPGLDQPLKVLRQYKKSVGRNVNVILYSGMKKTGLLVYADDEKLVIEESSGKKKQQEKFQSEIPFVQIKSTNLVFNF